MVCAFCPHPGRMECRRQRQCAVWPVSRGRDRLLAAPVDQASPLHHEPSPAREAWPEHDQGASRGVRSAHGCNRNARDAREVRV